MPLIVCSTYLLGILDSFVFVSYVYMTLFAKSVPRGIEGRLLQCLDNNTLSEAYDTQYNIPSLLMVNAITT